MEKKLNSKNQAGQTLIETIIAIFVLTTALTSGLALTVYVLANSRLSFNQLIATNLAREGTEVVRMMRDSNWLASDAKGTPPWDLTLCADIGNKPCYPRTYNKVPPYTDYILGAGSYRLEFTPATKAWTLNENPSSYSLYLQADGTYTHSVVGTSLFARKIVITENTNSPFTNQNSNSELIVVSTVGWHDKKCTWSGNDPTTAPSNCRISIEEHLTNWKDYK
jgi:hypothetical protein